MHFAESWSLLGPFPTGTREATWGLDPLEAYGGFGKLSIKDEQQCYASALGKNGTVCWSTVTATSTSHNDDTEAEATLDIAFPSIDWKMQQYVYGWSALQYQAWIRGYIDIDDEHETSGISLFFDPVLEFYVDGQRYFGGDFFSYRRAPLVLHLEPGRHRLDIRVLREVRAMGGVGEPTVSIALKMERSKQSSLLHLKDHNVFPDLVEGSFSGEWASIAVSNTDKHPLTVTAVESESHAMKVRLERPAILSAGQTRPLILRIKAVDQITEPVSLVVYFNQGPRIEGKLRINPPLPKVSRLDEPHLVTFLRPEGFVSTATLKLPRSVVKATTKDHQVLPILIQLHGAGITADFPDLGHSFDDIPDLPAAIITPNGATAWCGDDWHSYGTGDIIPAIEIVSRWIKRSSIGNRVSLSDAPRWLVSGHSNGGQGAWYTVTHWPDRVRAVAPVAAYTSIQNYVSYNLWRPLDPFRLVILQGTLSGFRHELLLENIRGIPIAQSHGDADDNVPVWHSRLMNQMLEQLHISENHTYQEIQGKGHVFDDMMTVGNLSKFYETHLQNEPDPGSDHSFTLVVANPAEHGPKNSFQIMAIDQPGQYGKLTVKASGSNFDVVTSNVRHFHFQPLANSGEPSVKVDKQDVTLPRFAEEPQGSVLSFQCDEHQKWHAKIVEPSQYALSRGLAQGGLHNILRSTGPFQISYDQGNTKAIALQCSRNLFQYFAADSVLYSPEDSGLMEASGTVIVVRQGKDRFQLPPSVQRPSPFSVSADGICVERHCYSLNRAVGIITRYRPDESHREILMIWGVDERGLELAARFLPMLTGVGQPDWMILSHDCWEVGPDGVLAMGFFDSQWAISRNSFFS